MFCVKCGNLLPDDAKYCNQCGMKARDSTNVKSLEEIEFQYKRGKECLDGGVWINAFRYFQAAAMQGHVKAQYQLAQMYQSGLGIPKSEKNAMEWYTAAAEHGYAEAQFCLAMNFLRGNTDIGQDFNVALKWLTLSAKQELGDALYILGKQYEGDLLPEEILSPDIDKARMLYKKAGDKGCKEAMMRLAVLELRTQVAKLNFIDDKDVFIDAVIDFLQKVNSLFKVCENVTEIYFFGVSANFEEKLKDALTYAELQQGEYPIVVIESVNSEDIKERALLTTHTLYIKKFETKTIPLCNVHSIVSIEKQNLFGLYYTIMANGNIVLSAIKEKQNAILLSDVLKFVIDTLKDLPFTDDEDLLNRRDKTMFCNKCGNQLSDGTQFCQKCGEKVHNREIKTYQPEMTVLEDNNRNGNVAENTNTLSNQNKFNRERQIRKCKEILQEMVGHMKRIPFQGILDKLKKIPLIWKAEIATSSEQQVTSTMNSGTTQSQMSSKLSDINGKKKPKKMFIIIGIIIAVIFIVMNCNGKADYAATVGAHAPFSSYYGLPYTYEEVIRQYIASPKWKVREEGDIHYVDISGKIKGGDHKLVITIKVSPDSSDPNIVLMSPESVVIDGEKSPTQNEAVEFLYAMFWAYDKGYSDLTDLP